MISYDELLQSNREDILRIAAPYGVSNVRIFGSVAPGEADEQSDIDFLVNMEPGLVSLTWVDYCQISRIYSDVMWM